MLISFDIVDIEFKDVLGPESQSGCVERESGFLFRGYTDPKFKWYFDGSLVIVELFLVVQYRNGILEACIQQSGNAGCIGFLFVSVADDIDLFVDLLLFVEFVDDLDIIGE